MSALSSTIYVPRLNLLIRCTPVTRVIKHPVPLGAVNVAISSSHGSSAVGGNNRRDGKASRVVYCLTRFSKQYKV
jgi:hypothetical protein